MSDILFELIMANDRRYLHIQNCFLFQKMAQHALCKCQIRIFQLLEVTDRLNCLELQFYAYFCATQTQITY